MGRFAEGIWLIDHLLALAGTLVQRRDMGADLAHFAEPFGGAAENRMGTSVSGRQFCPSKKGGSGVGKAREGRGTRVMLIVDGQGIPLSVYVDSAQPNERKLTAATLKRLRVPQRRGRPRTRPKVLVADRNFDGEELRRQWRQRGIHPCIPRQRKPTRKQPRRGRPLKLLPWYRQRWTVERTFAWLFNARRLQVRHERFLHVFDGFCLLACSLLCISLILK